MHYEQTDVLPESRVRLNASLVYTQTCTNNFEGKFVGKKFIPGFSHALIRSGCADITQYVTLVLPSMQSVVTWLGGTTTFDPQEWR